MRLALSLLFLALASCAGSDEPSTGTPDPTITGGTVIGRGMFAGRAGHNSMGSATFTKSGDEHELCFEADFEVTGGPDLIVFLSTRAVIANAGVFSSDVSFGPLLSSKGRQCYRTKAAIPEGALHAWIYCRAYTTEFALARLQ